MALSTLNLSLYTHGTPRERQQLASELLDSLSQHGFVKLVGHGVSRETINGLLNWVRVDFILLPKTVQFSCETEG